MQLRAPVALPDIPVLDVGPDFGIETLRADPARGRDLMEMATRKIAPSALRSLDRASKYWLRRHASPALPEIDKVAATLGVPGAYFLSCNYDWGCTCRVAPSVDGRSARLIRVLDWPTPGLGRYVVAAKIRGRAGPWVSLTWPGFTGVLQALAPGRFAIALNQAPMRRPSGVYPIDWALNRARVWRSPHPTAGHLLREVFATAVSFREAVAMLASRPIASPAIFSVAGLAADETAVIERTEQGAYRHDGAQTAANHWQAPWWQGSARGVDSAGRARGMHTVAPDFDPRMPWLKAPILNGHTRLVMMADAHEGHLMAQGYEALDAATTVLEFKA